MYKLFLHYVGKLVVYLHYKKDLDIYALCSEHKPERAKQRIPQKTRWIVWRRDSFTCVYCLTTKGPMTIDHVIPECEGGTRRVENLVTACPSCNNKKDRKSLEEFITSSWLIQKRKHNLRHLSTTQPVKALTGLAKISSSTGARN